MRRFQFSLEALLQVKAHQLEALQAEIAQMESLQKERLLVLDQLELDLERSGEFRLTAIVSGIDAESLQEYFRRWVYLFERIHQQHKAIEEAERALDVRRSDCLALHREFQMLEEMKTRARLRWWDAAQKEEQKNLDEFGTIRFVRNTGSL